MNQSCYIFGAGEYGNLIPDLKELSSGLVIAADGGFAHLSQWGVSPDLAVGDFDSLGFVPQGIEVIRHPVRKDDTDMFLAVQEGLSRGCSRFYLYGGLGGRLDHTLGNLQILAFLAEQQRPAFLLGENTAVTALCCGSLIFSPDHHGTLTLLSWSSRTEHVNIRGMLYSMSDGTMTCDYPLGISNEFLGQEAEISADRGVLMALWQDPSLLPLHRWNFPQSSSS